MPAIISGITIVPGEFNVGKCTGWPLACLTLSLALFVSDCAGDLGYRTTNAFDSVRKARINVPLSCNELF